MKPFTNKHSHEARARAALMNDMPIDIQQAFQMNTTVLSCHGAKASYNQPIWIQTLPRAVAQGI